jgi:V/A-type H+/Na+-transporting ATPase subunit C
MGALGTYSYINAKVRAKIGRLVTNDELDHLVELPSVEGIYDQLRHMGREEALGPTDRSTSVREVEVRLQSGDIADFKSVLKSAPKVVAELVRVLLTKYELENLKHALRIWHKKDEEAKSEAVFQNNIIHFVPYEEILAAADIESVIVLLEKTPYKKPFLTMIDLYKKNDAVFYLEIGLDIDYYQRLRKVIKHFSNRDQAILNRIIGIEIDIKNINWISRFKHYYDLPLMDVLRYQIPHGFEVKGDFVRQAYSASDMGSLVSGLLTRFYERIPMLNLTKETVSNMYMLEMVLWQFFVDHLRGLLQGYPFSIGAVLSYFYLKKIETDNIITIINGKYLAIDRDRIRDSLVRVSHEQKW